MRVTEWMAAAVALGAAAAGVVAATGLAGFPAGAQAGERPLASLAEALSMPSRGAAADPMRPSGSAGTGMAAWTGPAASPADGAADGAATLPQLQATHRAADGRRAALLDGRWRQVGERVGDLRVAAVGETDVVLLRGPERLTLSMPTPTIRTRPSAASQP